MPDRHRPAPIRALGTVSLTAVAINSMVGAGIFALPANVAGLLGPAGAAAYLVAGAATYLIALCFAEAGSRFRNSGGPYLYVRAAFGDLAAFEISWLYLLARITTLAAVANTFSDYLGYFWLSMSHGAGRALAITALLGALGTVHVLGIRGGAWVNNLFTLAKLGSLLVFCMAGAFLLNLRPALQLSVPGMAPLQTAAFLLMFALGGFENATIPAEEVRDPRRSLPVALIVSVGVVVAVYVLIQVVAFAALPALASDSTPLASAAAAFLGPAGGLLLMAGAALSTAGSNHVNVLSTPRLLYAVAKDGFLPARFSEIHPVYRTPVLAITVYTVLGWVLALTSVFSQLAALAAMTRLLMYAATCLSVPALRRKKPEPENGFLLPGGPAIPIAGLAVCVWMLGAITAIQELLAGAALLAGALLYLVSKRFRRAVPPPEPETAA
jgi:APA family basic amino acid/polyamine antiporter